MIHLPSLPGRLKNALEANNESMAEFERTAGLPMGYITMFIRTYSGKSQGRNVLKVIEEMQRRDWLNPVETPEKATIQQSDGDPFEYPFPDLVESDPRFHYKNLANHLTRIIAEQPNHPKNEESKEQLKRMTEMANAPEGYYPYSSVLNADPTRKLTSEERFYCIRNLPEPIVKKLFPNL